MTRGSTKHGPAIDDQLQHETEAITRGPSPLEPRVEEFREQEGAADDERNPDASLSTDEVENRADLARHLDRHIWPADRDALIASATANNAPDWILGRLRHLAGGSYENVAAVWEALGGGRQ